MDHVQNIPQMLDWFSDVKNMGAKWKPQTPDCAPQIIAEPTNQPGLIILLRVVVNRAQGGQHQWSAAAPMQQLVTTHCVLWHLSKRTGLATIATEACLSVQLGQPSLPPMCITEHEQSLAIHHGSVCRPLLIDTNDCRPGKPPQELQFWRCSEAVVEPQFGPYELPFFLLFIHQILGECSFVP